MKRDDKRRRTVCIPPEVFAVVEQLAEQHGTSRSGFLSELVAEHELAIAEERRHNGLIAELRIEARGLYAHARASAARLARYESIEGCEVILGRSREELIRLGALDDELGPELGPVEELVEPPVGWEDRAMERFRRETRQVLDALDAVTEGKS